MHAGFLHCGERGLLPSCGRASPGGGFSLQSSGWRARAQQVWLPGSARGTLPDQGLNPGPLHWQTGLYCLTTGKALNPYFNEITCREDLKGVELSRGEGRILWGDSRQSLPTYDGPPPRPRPPSPQTHFLSGPSFSAKLHRRITYML